MTVVTEQTEADPSQVIADLRRKLDECNTERDESEPSTTKRWLARSRPPRFCRSSIRRAALSPTPMR
jgi:hypothetical protein